jgi:hypothetical protein
MNITLQKILLFLVAYGLLAQLYSLVFIEDSKSPAAQQTSATVDLLAPKQRRTFFEHLYEDPSNLKADKKVDKRKNKKKRLNEKKENKMTKEFLDLVTNYAVKFNGLRLVLRDSNPFTSLGFYKEIAEKYYENDPITTKDFEKAHLGLINDPSYCEVSDFSNIYDPTKVFTKMQIFTDYDMDSRVRQKIIPALGVDVMPEIAKDMRRDLYNEKKYLLNYSISIFFTRSPDFHYFHEIGKNFLGVHQIYNHIPGNGHLRKIDLLTESFTSYKNKLPSDTCVSPKVVFPVTYKLHYKEECRDFFGQLSNPTNYTSWIMRYKYNVNAMKVFELDPKEKKSFISQFGDGSKCGTKKTPILAQRIVSPQMINDTHFIIVRSYMLVSSTNPSIAYYRDGHWDILPLIEKRKGFRSKFSSYEDLHEPFTQHFTFDRLEKILNAKRRNLKQENTTTVSKVESEQWLDNFVRREMKEAMVHIVRMNTDNLLRHSGVFEIFSVDFVMGEGGKFYLTEIRSSPKMLFTNMKVTNFYSALFKDMFEIQYSYLRSRIRRLRAIFPKIHETIADTRSIDFIALKKQFEKLNKNSLDSEFEISEGNQFKIIVDENLESAKAYFGLLSDSCFEK